MRVYNETQFEQYAKSIGVTDIDKKVASIAYNTFRHSMSENSVQGRKVNSLLSVYQDYVKYGKMSDKRKLEEKLEEFYPSYIKGTQIYSPLKKGIQIGGVEDGKIGKKAIKERADKLLSRLSMTDERAQKVRDSIQEEGLAAKKFQREKEMLLASTVSEESTSRVYGEIMEQIQIKEKPIKEKLETEYNKRSNNLDRYIESQTSIASGVEGMTSELADIKDTLDTIVKGQLRQESQMVKMNKGLLTEINGLMSGNTSWTHKIMTGLGIVIKHTALTIAKLTYNVMKFIYWSSWFYPIKCLLEKIKEKIGWISGFVLVLCIGGIWYSQKITVDSPDYDAMCSSLPQQKYCSYENIGYDMLNQLSQPYFNLEWSFDSVYKLGNEIVLGGYNPPSVILAEGKKAYSYIGYMYGNSIKEYIMGLVKEFAAEAANQGLDIAKESIRQQIFGNWW